MIADMRAICLLIGLFLANNVSAQFINGDFEQWDTISMFGQPYIDPLGWVSNNNNDMYGLASTPVTRGIDSTGYFARIESNEHGIDALLPGRLKQTIQSHNLNQIIYDYKCDYIFQAGSCVVNLYKGNTSTLLYTDSIFTEDPIFENKAIDILPDWILEDDSITIEFVAKGNLDDFDEQEDGHSVFFIDNVSASYISSIDNNQFQETFLVFPNPSRGEVFFETRPNNLPQKVKILSTNGTLLYTLENTGILNVQKFSEGIYYAVCIIGNSVSIKSFVVIK